MKSTFYLLERAREFHCRANSSRVTKEKIRKKIYKNKKILKKIKKRKKKKKESNSHDGRSRVFKECPSGTIDVVYSSSFFIRPSTRPLIVWANERGHARLVCFICVCGVNCALERALGSRVLLNKL